MIKLLKKKKKAWFLQGYRDEWEMRLGKRGVVQAINFLVLESGKIYGLYDCAL